MVERPTSSASSAFNPRSLGSKKCHRSVYSRNKSSIKKKMQKITSEVCQMGFSAFPSMDAVSMSSLEKPRKMAFTTITVALMACRHFPDTIAARPGNLRSLRQLSNESTFDDAVALGNAAGVGRFDRGVWVTEEMLREGSTTTSR